MRLLLVTGLVVVAACNPFTFWGEAKAQKDVADKATAHFHQLLDAARYDSIYNQADPDFRESVSEKDVNALWRTVQRRLGPVQGTTLASWNVNMSTGGGTQVRLIYRTAFAKDSATETFTWRIRDGKPGLLGYNVNSAALLRALADEKN